MKQIILSALFIASSVFGKGPCDQTYECRGKVFELGDRALCSGFKGCAIAEFGTDFNPICVGAEACAGSKVTSPPPKMLCNGFKACYKMKKGIRASEKIACNGLKSCERVIGALKAPQITCDGDVACQDKKMIATGTPPVGEKNDITCNGNKACVDGNLISDGTINCDGDIACKKARLAGNQIGCGGKRACLDARMAGPSKVYAYGFNAATGATIVGPDQGNKSKKKWTFEVRGLGMNGLLGTEIESNGAKTSILAYGYRSLVGAVVKCTGSSECTVECRSNACKGARIAVARSATLIMDPAGCDPLDADFVGPSKKDPTVPAKAQGIHCPTIVGPAYPTLGGGAPPAFETDAEIDELAAKWREEFKQTDDYLEMVESAEQAEAALDAMINKNIALYEDNLDLSLPEDAELEEEEFMVVDHMISNNNKSTSNILTSNLLTALIVFLGTSVGSLCYIAYKFGGNAETKALLQ